MIVLNISDPAGDTQTFEPRPRPATCVVAVKHVPAGRWELTLRFLPAVSVCVQGLMDDVIYFSRRVFVLVTTSAYISVSPMAWWYVPGRLDAL